MHAHPILRSRLDAVSFCCLGIVLAGCTGRLEPTTRPTLTPASAPQTAYDDAGLARSGAVGTAAQPGFYPLRVGNRWVHRLTATYRLIPSTGDAPPVETFEYLIHRRILPPIGLGDRTYLPEEIETVGPGGAWSYAVLYRQDASGLYEFSAIRALETGAARVGGAREVPPIGSAPTATGAVERLIATRPTAERAALEAAAHRLTQRIAALGVPGRALPGAASGVHWPGTAGPYELTRLRYPLESKSAWLIGPGWGAPLTAQVVGTESLELGPGTLRGHRIRLGGGYFGPDDSSEIWFGPSGYLMSISHIEAEATNPGGIIIGRWTYDQREALLDLSLVGPPLADLSPWYPRPHK